MPTDRAEAECRVMPLLAKEPELFPDDLFRLGPEWPWCVAHVRSRQEKALARHLLRHEVPYFVPQVERVAERSGRRFVSYLPLFPGYVFVRATAAARPEVWRSGVAVQILDVPDQELLERELLQIRRLQETGASLIPVDDFAPGEAVEIRDGPFRGYVGVVERHGRDARLIVSVSLLARSVAVELDASRVRRRPSPPAR